MADKGVPVPGNLPESKNGHPIQAAGGISFEDAAGANDSPLAVTGEVILPKPIKAVMFIITAEDDAVAVGKLTAFSNGNTVVPVDQTRAFPVSKESQIVLNKVTADAVANYNWEEL